MDKEDAQNSILPSPHPRFPAIFYFLTRNRFPLGSYGQRDGDKSSTGVSLLQAEETKM